MAYYGGVGDYYRGDYYTGRGDPLFGLALGPLIKKGIGLIGGALAKKGKTAAKIALPTAVLGAGMIGGPPPGGQMKVPGVKGTIQRVLPGGQSGYYTPRRRMNPANPKALRRAIRRVSGFGKLAQRSKRDIARAARAVGVTQSRGRRTTRRCK